MKIIFLDIDGVLVIRGSALRSGHVFPDFEPSCVLHLNQIIQKSGAKIVISSTWRHAHPKYIDLKQFLKDQGVQGEVIGMTHTGNSSHRGIKIMIWLEDWHNENTLSDGRIESYVILDDDSVRPFDRLVRTTFEYGLEEHHIQEALRILNESERTR